MHDLPRYWSLWSKRFTFSKEQIILAMISTFMSTNVSSESKVYTWVKSNNHTAIKSPKLQKRNLWTTVLFLYSCEKYLSDARNWSFFIFVYDTHFEIVALLGPLVYLSATFIFAQIFFSLCDHFCLCSYAPYGMPDWCSLCSSSQLNSSNLTTGIC